MRISICVARREFAIHFPQEHPSWYLDVLVAWPRWKVKMFKVPDYLVSKLSVEEVE